MEFRRRVPRTIVDSWTAWYIDQDDSDSAWKECRVMDISLIGVGLQLLGVQSDLIGHQLVVQVQAPVGESVTLRLKGRVVNLGDYPQDMTRAGLEFVGLAEMERSILGVLEQMQVAW
jgi:c-di-GMP-binding flagellar brake protein YcgR